MWLPLAFLSAFFIGCYDIFKKKSLAGNAVIPVLFFNTFFSALLLLPLALISLFPSNPLEGTIFYMPTVSIETHGFIFIKSVVVLSSWLFGYFGIKHLPLTITGPIGATRPVMTLVGALLIFGEVLNVYQWIGIILTIVSFFLLSISGRKEGIKFHKDKWVLFMMLAALLGACSGLYDKFLMQRFSTTAVQFWFNTYQCVLMVLIMMLLWYPKRKTSTPFEWRWTIIWISVFLTVADFIYFYALSMPGAMISVVSIARRSSVLISFAGGALFFHEKNLKGKAFDLVLIVIAMFFLYLGTK